MIDFVAQHFDALLFGLMAIMGGVAYWIGSEVGYAQGLEDGYNDGQANASR